MNKHTKLSFLKNYKILFTLILGITVLATFSGCKKYKEEIVILNDSSSSSSSATDSTSKPQKNNKQSSSSTTDSTPTVADINTSDVDFSRTGFSLDGMFSGTILEESADAGEEYINQIVFVGDSTTHGLKSYKMISKTNNVWTPKSGTLMLTEANSSAGKIVYNNENGESSEMLIKDAAAITKPKYMVITLGTNGISLYIEKNTDYYIGEYEKLINSIKEVSPDTKIIIQSAFPICSYYKNIDTISNERVNKANFLFAQLAEKLSVKFLNTAPVLKNSNGFFDNSLSNGDGIHLNQEGFKKELDFIRTHAYK